MIRTKQQADNHVTGILKILKTEKQRLMRGHQFAKIYYDIKEYSRAKDYLIGFLSIIDNQPTAYTLLAQILENLKASPQEIVKAYQTSLELDSQQYNHILKISELYSKMNISPEVASIWIKKLELHHPNSSLIFKLKSKFIKCDATNEKQDMIAFYETELAKDASDPMRCISLLKLYLEEGQIANAFNKILEWELMAQNKFTSSLEWYKFVDSFLETYKKDEVKTEIEKMLKLVVLIRLLIITISSTTNFLNYINILWSLDQELKSLQSVATKSIVFAQVLREAEAQYFFLGGVLLFNKAQRDRLFWKEAATMAYVCLLVSNNYNQLSNVADKFTGDEKKFLECVQKLFCLRYSQTSHMLEKKYGKDSNNNVLQSHVINYSSVQGKKRLVETLFSSNNRFENKLDDSFIINYNIQFQMPDYKIIKQIDREVQIAYGSEIEILVWICLHYYNDDSTQPEYPFEFASNLRYSCDNWDTAAAESLTQLDLEMFLLLTVKYAKIQLETKLANSDSDKPQLLPLLINGKLVMDGQVSWWSMAHQLTTNKSSSETFGHQRSTIQLGLETIRMVGLNKLPLVLLYHVSQTFEARLKEVYEGSPGSGIANGSVRKLNPVQMNALEQFVDHLWEKAISAASKPKIEVYHSSQSHKAKLFYMKDADFSNEDRQIVIDSGSIFKAQVLIKKQSYSEALIFLGKANSTEAKLLMSKVYTMMSETMNGNYQNGYENRMDTRGQYLFKARDTLMDALDNFRADRHNPVQSEILQEISEIERKKKKVPTATLR